ncbi:MAG: ATP-binding protein [Campylobacterota bacterium]|nr:ATP-binding protein [Campylobacterota bacterium]
MNRYATTDLTKRTQATKYNFIVYSSLLASVLMSLFGVYHLVQNTYFISFVELFSIFFLLANLLYLKQSKNISLSGEFFLGITSISSLIIFTNGGHDNTGYIWVILFPLVAFYLQGKHHGLLWILSHFLTLIVLCYFIDSKVLQTDYTYALMQQTAFAYIVIVILAYLNEKLKDINYQYALNSHNEITSVLDNMQDTFYRTDATYYINAITPSVHALLGYHSYELTGHSLINLLTIKDEREYFNAILDKNSGHIKNLELQVTHKNGSSIWILVNAHRYYSSSNEEVGIEGTLKDISEQKHYQVELIKLNELQEERINNGVKQLRKKDELMLQQAKMAQMGEMISMIAHQWRQPLATISAITQNLSISAMLKEPISNDLLNEKLSSVNSHVTMLSETIDDFRNFFRPDKEKNSVKLNNLIHKALDVLESSLNKHPIELTLDLNLAQPVMSFQNELLQVLINLIGNAIDAFDDKQVSKQIIIRSFLREETATITVSDNAGGIQEESIDAIFEPYFSTKETKNGTGLGLYMSKLIVEEHCQGSLSATNSENGAIFTLTLPA